MQAPLPKFLPSLVFDDKAEEAARFYTSIFKDSKIHNILHFNEGQPGPAGSVCLVALQLNGQEFQFANGGSSFRFCEGMSLYMNCDSQEEIDDVWDKLLEGGKAQECGWLSDKFGVYWQIAPTILWDMMKDPDTTKTHRVLNAIYKMVKLDVAAIKQAYEA
ncbi:VOC family protein [Fibrella sp. WM1]|uniref:VOC family protein n=1 Tax=Fibrella musci TaxID=3242485 RepID=UPI0035217214